MLTERFNIKPSDINSEIAAVEDGYKVARKPLMSRLRHLKDLAAMQTTMFKTADAPVGATIESTESDIDALKKACSVRTRHLNALKRVLLDEALEIADAAQSQLPIADAAPVMAVVMQNVPASDTAF